MSDAQHCHNCLDFQFSFFREITPAYGKCFVFFFCNLPTTFYLRLGSPFQGAAPVPDHCQAIPCKWKCLLVKARAPCCPWGSPSGCTEQEAFVLLYGRGRNLGRSWFWPKHRRGRLWKQMIRQMTPKGGKVQPCSTPQEWAASVPVHRTENTSVDSMRISVKIQSQVCLGFLLNHKEVMHKCLDKEKRVNLLEQALLHLKTQCWQFLTFHIHINHRSSHCKADLTPASYLGHQSSHWHCHVLEKVNPMW